MYDTFTGKYSNFVQKAQNIETNGEDHIRAWFETETSEASALP